MRKLIVSAALATVALTSPAWACQQGNSTTDKAVAPAPAQAQAQTQVRRRYSYNPAAVQAYRVYAPYNTGWHASFGNRPASSKILGNY
jgi:hypothetical protein